MDKKSKQKGKKKKEKKKKEKEIKRIRGRQPIRWKRKIYEIIRTLDIKRRMLKVEINGGLSSVKREPYYLFGWRKTSVLKKTIKTHIHIHVIIQSRLTNSMAYGTRRFNAAFTSAIQ